MKKIMMLYTNTKGLTNSGVLLYKLQLYLNLMPSKVVWNINSIISSLCEILLITFGISHFNKDIIWFINVSSSASKTGFSFWKNKKFYETTLKKVQFIIINNILAVQFKYNNFLKFCTIWQKKVWWNKKNKLRNRY